MGTEKDVYLLEDAYHTQSQQLAELKNLVLQHIEVDDDFSFKFDDIRDLLENHLKNAELQYEPPEFTCDDCAWPDGTLKEGIGCCCGRND